MFDVEQMKEINSRYFNIITVDEYDATIQRRNTGHYWYLHCTGVSGDAACIIFHKYSHLYYQYGRGNSFRQAIWSIQSHNRWQMNVRKTVK